jgi:hypothetical protein
MKTHAEGLPEVIATRTDGQRDRESINTQHECKYQNFPETHFFDPLREAH